MFAKLFCLSKMKTPNQQSNPTQRIIIETDEYIFPIQMEKIQYVVVSCNHDLHLHGFDADFHVSDSTNHTFNKLLEAGFIRIRKNTFVQPKQIAEYNIKTQKIVLIAGKTLSIQPDCVETINDYFAKMQ